MGKFPAPWGEREYSRDTQPLRAGSFIYFYMTTKVNKQILWLSLGFFFIFLGYNAVQQYITSFFSESDIAEVGFQSLIIIYLFFFISGPLSAVCVSKHGAKRCMLIGSIIYSIFIFILPFSNRILIWLVSIFLGFAASLLWTGQNSYLVRVSNEKEYGANSGLFNTLLTLGSAVGVLSLGLLISRLSFKISFLGYSFLPLVGLLFLNKLEDFRAKTAKNQLTLIKKSIKSIFALRLATFYFAFSFIFGLVIGILPIDIKNTLSLSYVGLLAFAFWIMPILFSYISGRISDITGRKRMILTSYGVGAFGLLILYFAQSQSALLLTLGVILLAIAYAIFRPMSFAFVGDVATEENLVSLTAFFWMAQNVGVLSALLISSQILPAASYITAIAVLLLSFVVLFPILKADLKEIRLRLTEQIQ